MSNIDDENFTCRFVNQETCGQPFLVGLVLTKLDLNLTKTLNIVKYLKKEKRERIYIYIYMINCVWGLEIT